MCGSDFGLFENSVYMPIGRKVVGIDSCIHRIVACLNAGGMETSASCCGHGKIPGDILFKNDEREILIFKNMKEADKARNVCFLKIKRVTCTCEECGKDFDVDINTYKTDRLKTLCPKCLKKRQKFEEEFYAKMK